MRARRRASAGRFRSVDRRRARSGGTARDARGGERQRFERHARIQRWGAEERATPHDIALSRCSRRRGGGRGVRGAMVASGEIVHGSGRVMTKYRTRQRAFCSGKMSPGKTPRTRIVRCGGARKTRRGEIGARPQRGWARSALVRELRTGKRAAHPWAARHCCYLPQTPARRGKCFPCVMRIAGSMPRGAPTCVSPKSLFSAPRC